MEQREKEIFRVTFTGFFVNLVLTTGKIVAGILGQSSAMVADGLHSASDFLTDIVVLFFVKVSAKPHDKCHDYGHGKYETLATVIIGLVLFVVGVGVIWNGVEAIYWFAQGGETITQPGMIALWAAVVSIVVKEWLYQYTSRVGKRIKSPVTIANAWHHRSDSFSSIGTLVGIGGARFLGPNWRVLDPLAAVIVGVFILRISYKLTISGLNELLERSLSDKEEGEILTVIKENPVISDPHHLKTRRIGANIAVEFHIRLDEKMSVKLAHDVCEDVENRLKEKYGKATQVIVHVEPKHDGG
ncbi:MAG: cation diffusion facilitator family transporter [Prevotellaceae bacterium]|jgi:cation diffusion facilitator family transporter|nr:cation diffusion facilitator family transporter [Prevotellaceae bacterium]